ncbi:hypothetical protein [Clostridium botulinum]|uniref:hypothetical protein n=1 Tax=Clostridium botulinum TaxID=1491 RepID=UPI001C9A91D0|nr:hypothetical protein [Clostridium botulinum]MBY6838655.1 hypothetical protein [Clostridium botulinum]
MVKINKSCKNGCCCQKCSDRWDCKDSRCDKECENCMGEETGYYHDGGWYND